jgi:hypothetical protein
MAQGVVQPSFTSGEISPSLYGRVDLTRYYTGLRTCRNFIVRQFGGVSNRPGTKFCAAFADSSRTGRLVPFEFSTSQAYVLEFTEYTIRIYKDGGLIVWPSGPNAGLPAEVETIYLEADLPYLKFVQSADVMTICHPSYPVQQLSRTDHHLWTISAFSNVEGPFQEINVDTAKTLYASTFTGSTTLTASSAVFTSDMVGQMIRIEQAPDAMTKKWEVQKAIVINDIRRAGSNYYQAVSAGTTGTVRPSALEGVESDGDPGVTWRYLHSGFGIVLITGVTSSTVATGTVLNRLPDSVVTGGLSRGITGVIAGAPEVPADPGPYSGAVNARVTCPAHGFTTGDYVTITGVVGMTGINVTAQIIVINVNTFDLSGVYGSGAYVSGGTAIKTLAGTNTYKWAIEAWGGSQGYPAAAAYFQQRQCFAGSEAQPQTVWDSRTGGFTDFGTSVPLLDDDAVTFTLNSRKANEIRHFVELSQLILLTSDGPFIIQGGQDGLIIPGKISTKRQSASGASHVAPLIVGSHALYIQEKGSQVRSLGYDFSSDAFIGNDLTIISSHMFYRHTLTGWAFQTVPFSVAWAVRDDGALLGLTYMPEQEVVGWHRHDTDGFFESVCCITEGDEDVVYLLVRRTINGVTKRYVERMSTRFFESLKDAFFVDSGLTYDGRNETATTMTVTGGTIWDHTELLTVTASSTTGVNGGTGFVAGDVGDEIVFFDDDAGIAYRLRISEVTGATSVKVYANKTLPLAYRSARADWAFAHNILTGLDHLEGKTLDVLADGNVVDQCVVSGGSITIPMPAAVVHAGLPIVSDFETLDVSAAGQNIRDKQKLINHVSLLVEESMGVMVGPDENHLTEFKQRGNENYDMPATPLNQLIDIRIQATWNKSGRVFVRQAQPLPVTILAVIPEVSTGGS